MDDIRIELICPGCSEQFLVSARKQGKIATCPECDGWMDIPEIGRPPTSVEIDEAASVRSVREWELQTQENTRQIAERADQLRQAQLALDRHDKQDDRFDDILGRMEKVVD